jgi:hypothetical protein
MIFFTSLVHLSLIHLFSKSIIGYVGPTKTHMRVLQIQSLILKRDVWKMYKKCTCNMSKNDIYIYIYIKRHNSEECYYLSTHKYCYGRNTYIRRRRRGSCFWKSCNFSFSLPNARVLVEYEEAGATKSLSSNSK